MRTGIFIFVLALATAQALVAQTPTAQQESYTFNLEQCIEFAKQNQQTYLNTKLDIAGAKAQVGQVQSVGLPQANISGQYLVNPQVQKQFVPANAFSSPQLTALFNYVGDIGQKTNTAPPDALLPSNNTVDPSKPSSVGFGVMYSSQATLSVTQLLFDGTFFVGLQAAKALVKLSEKSLATSEYQLIENVTKAYYLVVINKERIKLFDNNISRLDSTLKTLKISRDAGFVEDVDVKRIEVTLNNLLIEKEKFRNLEAISLSVLKLQMGFPMDKSLSLTGSINDLSLSGFEQTKVESFNYNSRPEYDALDARKQLLTYDIKQNNMGYLPRLVAFFNYGQNTGAFEIKDIFNRWNWKEYHNYGLSLNVPVFDGFQKSYKIQQARVNLNKADNDLKNLKTIIDFQIDQSSKTLENSVKTLNAQKKNLELAEEVVRVSRLKYVKGVGSNLDLITAEASLKETQINYYNALYDAMIAKIDYDKANGNLK